MAELLHREITDRILACFYRVGNALGHGFFESVYHNALIIELQKVGLRVRSRVRLPVRYDGQLVGDFEADLVIEECVVLEIKAAHAIEPRMTAQAMNYLRASDIELALVLNFGETLDFRRVVFENARKNGARTVVTRKTPEWQFQVPGDPS